MKITDMTDREQKLLAALKAIQWQVTLLDVWTAEQSIGQHIRPHQESSLRERIDALRAAIASADASVSRAVSPDQQAVIAEAERLLNTKLICTCYDSHPADAEWCRAYTLEAQIIRKLLAALSPQEPR